MDPVHESPEYVKLSLAAAMQLGYSPARFHRGARMSCINLLLTYSQDCAGNCSYCGLARDREVSGDRSFIRVPWPTKPIDDICARIASNRPVKRVCISMITHARSLGDTVLLASRIRKATDRPVSVLIAPTVVGREHLVAMRSAGVDKIGVAFDLATEALFERHRGRGVSGPHRWDRYWRVFSEAVEVFGGGQVGSHFIVGLGESEREMVMAFQRVRDLGGVNHLFSFYPEAGSTLSGHPMPPMDQYRRIQIACELIDSGTTHAECFRFDDRGKIECFGVPDPVLEQVIESGQAFRTRGCKGCDGEVACNRPYANSLPGDAVRNYPFPPTSEDVRHIRAQFEAPLP